MKTKKYQRTEYITQISIYCVMKKSYRHSTRVGGIQIQILIYALFLPSFPHSQHRTTVITIGIQILFVRSPPESRWKFHKANWSNFAKEVNTHLHWISSTAINFKRFRNFVIVAAKIIIPREFQKQYLPGWTQHIEELQKQHTATGNLDLGNEITTLLTEERCKKWKKLTEKMNFYRKSRALLSLVDREQTPLLFA